VGIENVLNASIWTQERKAQNNQLVIF